MQALYLLPEWQASIFFLNFDTIRNSTSSTQADSWRAVSSIQTQRGIWLQRMNL
jgi:hypothetical protein